MRLIGFSTGAFHKFMPAASREAINLCWELGAEAVELGCLELDCLDRLLELGRDDFSGFKHISLHAPMKGIIYGYNRIASIARDKIYGAHREIGFDNIVLHPDRLEEPGLFAGLDLPISFENMESRKNNYRHPDDFEALYGYFKSRRESFAITLDLAHAYDSDDSMSLAAEFIRKFKEDIREIHVSGFNGHHVPAHLTGQKDIIMACPAGSAPIIIESACDNFEQAKEELQYIKALLSGRLDI